MEQNPAIRAPDRPGANEGLRQELLQNRQLLVAQELTEGGIFSKACLFKFGEILGNECFT